MSYDDVNDYEVLSVVADNEDATEFLFEKYQRLIEGLAKKSYALNQNKGLDLNDLVQEARLGFSTAINTFDDSKEVAFVTYARTCIERRLISLSKEVTRSKHLILNESYSIESLANDSRDLENLLEDNQSNPADKVLDNENVNWLIKQVRGVLTPFENSVFDLKISGFTYREIAKILDKDTKAIDNATSRIKVKIQKFLK